MFVKVVRAFKLRTHFSHTFVYLKSGSGGHGDGDGGYVVMMLVMSSLPLLLSAPAPQSPSCPRSLFSANAG